MNRRRADCNENILRQQLVYSRRRGRTFSRDEQAKNCGGTAAATATKKKKNFQRARVHTASHTSSAGISWIPLHDLSRKSESIFLVVFSNVINYTCIAVSINTSSEGEIQTHVGRARTHTSKCFRNELLASLPYADTALSPATSSLLLLLFYFGQGGMKVDI